MSVYTGQALKSAFGRAVRKFRTDVGLSQERLADLAGLNRTYVGDVERGERNIAVVNMYKLARAMGVKLADLVAEMEKQIGR